MILSLQIAYTCLGQSRDAICILVLTDELAAIYGALQYCLAFGCNFTMLLTFSMTTTVRQMVLGMQNYKEYIQAIQIKTAMFLHSLPLSMSKDQNSKAHYVTTYWTTKCQNPENHSQCKTFPQFYIPLPLHHLLHLPSSSEHTFSSTESGPHPHQLYVNCMLVSAYCLLELYIHPRSVHGVLLVLVLHSPVLLHHHQHQRMHQCPYIYPN